MSGWRNSRLLVLAVVIAAALQTTLIVRSAAIGADGILFIRIARQLPQGVADTFRAHDQHPGFPAMILATAPLVHAFTHSPSPESWMLVAQVVTFVCGLASIVVVWLFARELFGTATANVAALIFAVLPTPRSDAAGGQSDTPHLLFYLTAVWLACTAIRRGDRWLLGAAAVASSIAFWIRPEGWEVLLVALVAITYMAAREHWSTRRWALDAAVLVGTALLVAGPYFLIAGKLTSKQLPFVKQQVVPTYIEQMAEVPVAATVGEQANTAQPPEAQSTADAVNPPIALASTEPRREYSLGLIVGLLGKAIAQLVVCLCQGFKFVFIPFYLVSWLVLLRRDANWTQIGFLVGLAALHMVLLLYVYVMSGYIWHRHVLPLVGLAMPFTALGLLASGEWFAARLGKPRLGVVALLLAATGGLMLPYALRPFNREFIPVIEATRWVESLAQPGTGVISNSPYVGYFGTLPLAEVGPSALTVDAALAVAPPAHYYYVVLHVGAHGYQPQWIDQLASRYRQVRRYADPYCPSWRPREVLVFEIQEQNALRDTHDDPRKS